MSKIDDPSIFFVHIMKTGGATFRQHLLSTFPKEEVFPFDEPSRNPQLANIMIDGLLDMSPERRARIRVYTGHFPFVVTEMLGVPVRTFTILREPVSRTISYLKHCKRRHPRHRHLSLEEIYEDKFSFPFFIHNHQSKVFAMTRDDKLDSVMDSIEIDDTRLAIARSNLEKVDALGINERYGEFLDDVATRFGIRVESIQDRHVSTEPWDTSKAFRRRIASDNAADVEFYEFAKKLERRRRKRR